MNDFASNCVEPQYFIFTFSDLTTGKRLIVLCPNARNETHKGRKTGFVSQKFILPGNCGWIRGELFFLQASGLSLFSEFLEVKVFS
jgi:hypothetical protein